MRANAFECASCPLSRPAACYVLSDALCLRHLNLRWPRYQYPALWFINWAPTRPSHGLYALPNDTINSRVGRAAFSMRRSACGPITNHAWILTACAPTDATALFCIQITCNPLCPFCRGRHSPSPSQHATNKRCPRPETARQVAVNCFSINHAPGSVLLALLLGSGVIYLTAH